MDRPFVAPAVSCQIRQLFSDELRKSTTIFATTHERDTFIKIVFRKIDDIIPIHEQLSAKLTERQALAPIVEHILDILDEVMPAMEIYTQHCPTQTLANQCLERELKNNPNFRAFHDAQLKNPEMRRLPLTSFLGRTLTRLGKYPIVR